MKSIADHNELSRRLEEIKTELDETQTSIGKLFGFSRNNYSNFSSQYNNNCTIVSSANKFLNPQKRNLKQFSEDSFEESENELSSKKNAVRSVIKVRGTRRDVIRKQNCNTNIQSRNRRMFGMVQSTLQKFQDEAVERQSQDLKRIKIEQKLQAAEEEERNLVEKQKLNLFSKKREKLLELNCLKQMMELTEPFEVWENNQRCLLNYNMTETEPSVCFLPVSHTSSSKEHLEKSKVRIQDKMQNEREAMEKKLAAIVKLYLHDNHKMTFFPGTDWDAMDLESDSVEKEKCIDKNLHFSEDELSL